MDKFGGEFGESCAGDVEENEGTIKGIEDDVYELMTDRTDGVSMTLMTTQLIVQP